MSTANKFHPSVVATIIVGNMLSYNRMEGVYKILNHMTGEAVFTHQIGRIMQEASPVLKKALPEFTEWVNESGYGLVLDEDSHKEWLGRLTKRWGEELEVPVMDVNQHESIDPFSELAEKMHPDKIIQVDVPAKE
jgi:hypothetical protein